MSKGLISKIQRYSTKDGPGLRTTVFMVGCNLRCKWCANPELIQFDRQVFYHKERCQRCGICVNEAVNNSIILGDEGCIIDRDNCTNIIDMIDICPYDAYEIVGEWIEAEDLVKKLVRDNEFYQNSGGGVTFSGGEAGLQAEFIMKCCKLLKNENIHICLDTAGMLSWEILEPLIDCVDMVLYDIKAFDNTIHYQCTLKNNYQILKNLEMITKKEIPVYVRMVIVPNENDNFDDIKRRLDYIKLLGKNIIQVDILKYHNFGEGKYYKLGLNYELDSNLKVNEELIEKVSNYATKLKLQFTIEN